jgi:hypothetical protein
MNDIVPTPALHSRRISRKVRAAIDLMESGKARFITDAAEQVGLSREHLSRTLAEPHVVEFMHQKARRTLANAAVRASKTKVDLLDAESERVRDMASTYVLGLAGIKPASEPAMNVNINIRAGYVIDLSDDPKVIDHV